MILETERLVIRKFNHEDIDLIYDINNDPECIRFNSWDSMSYEDCQKDVKKWMNNYSDFLGTGAFCVESKNKKDKIGMAFIIRTNINGEFEIGFRLRSMHWYKGYAKEIPRGFINYSRNTLNAHFIVAEVYTNNIKSRNVFEKLGFSKFNHPSGPDGLVYRYDVRKN